jgi:hypothetical protein
MARQLWATTRGCGSIGHMAPLEQRLLRLIEDDALSDAQLRAEIEQLLAEHGADTVREALERCLDAKPARGIGP